MKDYPGIRNPPKPTRFIYPNGYVIDGTVVEEVRLERSGRGGDYVFVIQEIEYNEPPDPTKENPWIRFGYYKKSEKTGKYNWTSKQTFHTDKEGTLDLINNAKNKGIL